MKEEGKIAAPWGKKKMMKAFVTGVAVGTTLGLLVAPQEGSKTRKKIKSMADDLKNDLKRQINPTTV